MLLLYKHIAYILDIDSEKNSLGKKFIHGRKCHI
jgi:hypothetical protein